MPKRKSAYLLRTETFLLYLFPPILIISNYLSFQFFVRVSENKQGYLTAMIFYWLIWCIIPFLLFVSKGNRKLLLKIKRINWWQALLLIVSVLLALFFGPFKSRIGETSPLIISLSFLYAVINAFSEELLWRGLLL
jgi:membrane protease YdiL (CAAX protease family)